MDANDDAYASKDTIRIKRVAVTAVCGVFAVLVALCGGVLFVIPDQPIGDGDYSHARGGTHIGFGILLTAFGLGIWAFCSHRPAPRFVTAWRLGWWLAPLLIIGGIALVRYGQSLGSYTYHRGAR